MKIGEVARQAGVSIDTVRFYERRGVLPEPERLPSGYRVYEPATVERIKLVGNEPSPSSPDAFKARIAADIDKWTKVVDAAGIERI